MKEILTEQTVATAEQSPQKEATIPVNPRPDSAKRFKSSDELIRAYTNLEKEFTKRSQRLKSLERELEAQKIAPKTEVYEQPDWTEKVETFLKANPSAAPFKRAIAEEITAGNLKDNPACLELALAKVLVDNYKTPASLLEDDEFIDTEVMKSSKIRDRIIKDYLCAVRDVKAPKTVGRGGQPAVTPPLKPKNFDEAGRLAEKLYNGANKK
jgi:hypothetical protein